MSAKSQGCVTKKALWSIVLFYLLIVFEIAYMAGPFAVYFYGIYNPVLKFFNQSDILSILNSFFLPHVARETSSVFLNIHEYIGACLAIFGFIGFCIGACQIYYSKFTRKGAVIGGVYNVIRHPQYTSFGICGLGLLIMWPRFINLFLYVTMFFIYYLLARAEEKECADKFGQTYIDYMSKTTMFFPIQSSFIKNLSARPKSKGKKILRFISLYILVCTITLGAAKGLTAYSINNLYGIYTQDSATVSLCEIEADKMKEILKIAASDETLKTILDMAEGKKFINYILPQEWYAAEIPMNGIRYRAGHLSPANYDKSKYKVIFTIAQIRRDMEVTEKQILTNVLERKPLAEVWVDIERQTVERILNIPTDYKYRGIPVAIY